MKINLIPTKGERFKAARRRDGLSQEECAKRMNLHRMTTKYWEDGTPSTPDVKIKLNEGELYFIIRERLDIPLKKAAELIGISHVTLIKLEKQEGGLKVLKDFYDKYIQTHKIKDFN